MNKHKKYLSTAVILAIIVGMIIPAAILTTSAVPSGQPESRLQPALADAATADPNQMVRVIVQKANPDDQAESLVEYWGGQVIKDLEIINAFAAQMPARAAVELSQTAAVNWVSLDAPVVPAAKPGPFVPDHTIRDEFNSETYGGNDGTVAWSGDWQEHGEADGPGAGLVRVREDYRCVASSCLRLGGDEVNLRKHGATRRVDLRGAVSAHFSFSYYRDIDEGGGEFYPMLSYDGGDTWINLDGISLWSTRDKSLQTASYDLTPYLDITQELEVGFLAKTEEIDGYVYIDDTQVEYALEKSTYIQTLGVDQLHAEGLTGQGISVAIIDSGIGAHQDFNGRLQAISDAWARDAYGHGTHVAGIAGGDGSASDGLYTGVAPGSDFFTLGVSDANGMAYESDVVEAMQWIFENKDLYDIRVVNLSLNSTVEDSYDNSPMPAAAEILWFNNIVVVASVGNKGPAGGHNTAKTAPANDPFIITVGASDEKSSPNADDDVITAFSSHGTTLDGHERPDLIAPGYNIISALSPDSTWDDEHPDKVGFGGEYIRLSGTSMAAPMVTGVVALLLEDEPTLTPNQVKYRLLHSGTDLGGYPYLDAYAAIHSTTTESANQEWRPQILLAKMALIAFWASENGGENIDWGNVNWDAVNWNAVNWNAVNWNAVNWNAVNWNAVNWNAVNWNAVNWNAVNWNAVNWNAVNWNSINWNSVNWNSVEMDGIFWDKGNGKRK